MVQADGPAIGVTPEIDPVFMLAPVLEVDGAAERAALESKLLFHAVPVVRALLVCEWSARGRVGVDVVEWLPGAGMAAHARELGDLASGVRRC